MIAYSFLFDVGRIYSLDFHDVHLVSVDSGLGILSRFRLVGLLSKNLVFLEFHTLDQSFVSILKINDLGLDVLTIHLSLSQLLVLVGLLGGPIVLGEALHGLVKRLLDDLALLGVLILINDVLEILNLSESLMHDLLDGVHLGRLHPQLRVLPSPNLGHFQIHLQLVTRVHIRQLQLELLILGLDSNGSLKVGLQIQVHLLQEILLVLHDSELVFKLHSQQLLSSQLVSESVELFNQLLVISSTLVFSGLLESGQESLPLGAELLNVAVNALLELDLECLPLAGQALLQVFDFLAQSGSHFGLLLISHLPGLVDALVVQPLLPLSLISMSEVFKFLLVLQSQSLHLLLESLHNLRKVSFLLIELFGGALSELVLNNGDLVPHSLLNLLLLGIIGSPQLVSIVITGQIDFQNADFLVLFEYLFLEEFDLFNALVTLFLDSELFVLSTQLTIDLLQASLLLEELANLESQLLDEVVMAISTWHLSQSLLELFDD